MEHIPIVLSAFFSVLFVLAIVIMIDLYQRRTYKPTDELFPVPSTEIPEILTFADYQRLSRTTAMYPRLGENYVYPALGLAGETGEVCEKLKKLQRDHNDVLTDEYREKIKSEIADALWYISQLCTELGIDFEDAAKSNLEKLFSRKERGVIKGEGDNR